MTNRHTLVASIFAAAALAGCAETTTGSGQLTSLNGYAAERVSFQIREELFKNSAVATATLKNGEMFQGKMVIEKSRSEDFGSSYLWDDDKSDDEFGLFENSSITYSPKARGVLMSHARSMECQMTLSDASLGFSAGGIGTCRLSTGETLPVQF